MTYVVTQPCCADASCVVACPVNCIHPAPGEPGFAEAEMLFIDPAGCVGCGACTTACPVGAIVPDTDLTPEQQPFLALNADYFVEAPHADRPPLAPVSPQRRLRDRGPVRVAVVGAGPAGMFTADELLRHPEVRVDVYDRLPTPYGLVRTGVAPDHQGTKAVTDLFARIESEPGFSYRLGVEVGREVTHDQLAAQYHAVVYAVGASGSRSLGIEGEQLPGSVAAGDLVAWYNGHPDQRDLRVPLEGARVVVVGTGNVALDVARVLTAPADVLTRTDVAEHAEEALLRNRVREVVLLGRGTPSQAAFTVPELIGLRALVRRGLLEVVVDTGDGPLEVADRKTALLAEMTRGPGREVSWLTPSAPPPAPAATPEERAGEPRGPRRRKRPQEAPPRLVLRFGTRPVRLLGESAVEAIEVERDGVTETLAACLVVRSIGFRGTPVPGLPFDEVTSAVPHAGGRVEPGTYVVGWAKRGPRGFIGTNRADARDTVSRILDDLDAGLPDPAGSPAPEPWPTPPLDLADWRAVDAEERRRGAARGRPRLKLGSTAEARRVAATARTSPGRSKPLEGALRRLPGYRAARSRRTSGA